MREVAYGYRNSELKESPAEKERKNLIRRRDRWRETERD